MSDAFPSMKALLAMLAIAGYQNRDKIAEMLRGSGAGAPGGAPSSPLPGGLGNVFGQQAGLGAGGAGGFLGGALGPLVAAFKQNGQGAAADSWVGSGANQSVSTGQVKQAIGADTLAALARQTGLSETDILSRLSQRLPDAVDQYTPNGRLPS